MIGTRLGPYEVVAPLGAGGMGEVYRAREFARFGFRLDVESATLPILFRKTFGLRESRLWVMRQPKGGGERACGCDLVRLDRVANIER